ncbi:CMGC/GSK protein kinase [Aphelenchoides avenae]|nr:CMGC/GSK protein kinase [Aphelenchus avenae]
MAQARTTEVYRVHGPGNDRKATIMMGHEVLHAKGAFGNVWKARMYAPVEQPVAIKKVWPHAKTNSVISAELYFLQRVSHPCIVKLLFHYVVRAKTEAYHCLVFDFLPMDLTKLRMQKPGRRFPDLDAKLYSWQLFSALDFINGLGIAHRDVKPANLLVDDTTGVLKLADFGSATILLPKEEYDDYQVTRYYRAPELVFGSRHYTTAIAELHSGQVLLNGRDRYDQGRLVVDIFGYPSEEEITSMGLPKRPRFARRKARGLNMILRDGDAPQEARDLVGKLLIYAPEKRLSYPQVFAHTYFDALRTDPPPTRPNGQPIPALGYTTAEPSSDPKEPLSA